MTTKSFEARTDNNNGESVSNNTHGSSFESTDQNLDSSGTGGNSEGGNANSGSVDVNKLIKRVNDSQQFIETLKSERQSDRQLVDEQSKVIKELQEQLARIPTTDDILEQVRQRTGSDEGTRTLDINEVANQTAKLVREQQTQEQLKQQADANFKSVATSLRSELGSEGLNKKITDLAQENGMTYNDYVSLAERSPKAALKLFGISGSNQQSTNTPLQSSVNTYGFDTKNQKDNSNNNNNSTDKDALLYGSDKQRVEAMQKRFKSLGIDY